jgi:hypothetical protein
MLKIKSQKALHGLKDAFDALCVVKLVVNGLRFIHVSVPSNSVVEDIRTLHAEVWPIFSSK